MNRTLEGAANGTSAQGRPLCHLIAWLWAAPRTKERSVRADLRRGKGTLAAQVSFERRPRARRLTEANPRFQEWKRVVGMAERPRRPAEAEEPEGLP